MESKPLKVKWPKVMEYYDFDQKPILNWIDLGNGTMFRIAAFFVHGFPEEPSRGLMIGIERKGCFFFKMHSELEPYHWDYISEKLYLQESDARAIADWINAQIGFEAKQQGEYNENYIREVEPYGLGGENFIMPLVPEIIEDEDVS